MNELPNTNPDFIWTDFVNPTKETYDQIAKDLGVNKKILYNCMDSDYLPHLENLIGQKGEVQFIILRLMEPKFQLTADTVQELTTKVALFINQQKIISIHRLALLEVDEINRKVKNLANENLNKNQIMSLFFEQVTQSFDQPLIDLEQKLDKFEEKIFQNQKTKSLLLEGFYIKRKASAFRKVIKLSSDVLNKLASQSEIRITAMEEVKDKLNRNLFYADEVYENIQALLNFHMTIESQKTNEASYRTNEIMRVLTVSSIFFLPLNFLAGVFGMNFEKMPLLKDPLGFWICISSMMLISFFLIIYVIKKGWLSNQPPTN